MMSASASSPSPQRAVQRPRSRRWRVLVALAAAYPAALSVLLVVQRVLQARSGPLALVAVLAPYLFLPIVAILPLLLLRGTALLRLAVAVCLLCGLPFAPWLPVASPSADPSGVTLTVMTWNVAFGYADREVVRRFVESHPADIVALEEEYTSWWDADYARWQAREAALARVYPHQVRLHQLGLTILSSYPLLEYSMVGDGQAERDGPPIAWGRFDLGGGRTVVVAVAHPRNPTRSGCDLRRLCYDPATRDAELRQVRAVVEPFLQRDEPLVLVGDLNLTEREPAYHELAAGLWDAQQMTGGGLGHTWRPFPLARFGMPLLRIDYVLGSEKVRPLGLARDCTAPGADHCALIATLALP